MNKNELTILYRVCDKIETLHLPRPFGLDKKTIIQICFKSVINSFPNSNIVLICDDCSEQTIEKLKEIGGDNIKGILNEDLKPEGSLKRAFSFAKELDDNAVVYFCEDDYLHLNCGFLTDIAKMGLVVHPTDYPDQYKEGRIFPSYIYLYKSSYFRTINTTTFTFMCLAKFIKDNYNYLISIGNDDSKLSILFGYPSSPNNMLVSPIPSLSAHLHIGTIPSFINWEAEVNKLKEELNIK